MPRRRARQSFSPTRVARALIGVVLVGAMLAVTSFVLIAARGRDRGNAPSDAAFGLRREAQAAYDEQRYAASADAYRKLIELYPCDFVLHFNRACALAHDGRADDAMASLASAVRFGFEDVEVLGKSKALEPLRADARFAQVEKDATAARDERHIVYVPPNLDAKRPAPLVVLIHGRGSAPRNVLPMWTATAEKLGAVLALPKGATRLEPGRYAWEPEYPTDNAQLDWPAAEAAVDRAVAAALAAHPNIDRSKVVLAGFSQGGYVALRLLHDHPEKYLGVVTFVTVYNREGIDSWDGVAPKRAYLVAGALDTLCPHSRDARDDLTAAGFDVRYDEVAGMSHEIPPEYEARQARALRFILEARD